MSKEKGRGSRPVVWARLAAVVAALMFIVLAAAITFDAGSDDSAAIAGSGVPADDNVAVINGVNYTSLSAAVQAADSTNYVIELLADVHEDDLSIDKSLTILGNGKILTGNIIFNAVGSGSYSVVINNVKFNGSGTTDMAIKGQNQTSADIRTLNLTLNTCEFSGYTMKCIYLTNVEKFDLQGCTFNYDFTHATQYGDYAVDLNLVGVSGSMLEINDNTFIGHAKNAAVKVAQRGANNDTDDVKADITSNVNAKIRYLNALRNNFNDASSGVADFIIGSSPNGMLRSYCAGFNVNIGYPSVDMTLCYRGDAGDAPFVMTLGSKSEFNAQGQVLDGGEKFIGLVDPIKTDGVSFTGKIPSYMRVPCRVGNILCVDLGSALNNVSPENNTIDLLMPQYAGDVRISESVTINGGNNTLYGTLAIDGDSSKDPITVVFNNVYFNGQKSCRWAIIAENETTDTIRPLDLTLKGCYFTEYSDKCVYLTTAQKLNVSNCTFNCNFAPDSEYGDYALDLNLIGVSNADITISSCTFNGSVKNGAIKITQRGDSRTDDADNGFANDVLSTISSVNISDVNFQINCGIADIIIGSSPGTSVRSYCVGFPVDITSKYSTSVCYRGDVVDGIEQKFKINLSDAQRFVGNGYVVNNNVPYRGLVNIAEIKGTTEGPVPNYMSGIVCTVHGILCSSFQDAYNKSVALDDVIEIQDDITVNDFLIDKGVTINGNGHSVKGRLLFDANSSTLSYKVIIKNVVFDGTDSTPWALEGSNESTDTIRPVDLTLNKCTFRNYTQKCVYLTNATDLTIENCRFEFDFSGAPSYGDYALDLNLIGVGCMSISITDSTFDGYVKTGAVKITQRGSGSDTDDKDNGFANNVSSNIKNVSIKGNTFVNSLNDSRLGDIVIGSSPKDAMRTFCIGFPLQVVSKDTTSVCYRLDKVHDSDPFKVTLTDGQTLDAVGSRFEGTGSCIVNTTGLYSGSNHECITAHCTITCVYSTDNVTEKEVVRGSHFDLTDSGLTNQVLLGWYDNQAFDGTAYDQSYTYDNDATFYAKVIELKDQTVEIAGFADFAAKAGEGFYTVVDDFNGYLGIKSQSNLTFVINTEVQLEKGICVIGTGLPVNFVMNEGGSLCFTGPNAVLMGFGSDAQLNVRGGALIKTGDNWTVQARNGAKVGLNAVVVENFSSKGIGAVFKADEDSELSLVELTVDTDNRLFWLGNSEGKVLSIYVEGGRYSSCLDTPDKVSLIRVDGTAGSVLFRVHKGPVMRIMEGMGRFGPAENIADTGRIYLPSEGSIQWENNEFDVLFAVSGNGTVSQQKVTVPYGTPVSINGNVLSLGGTDITATPSGPTAQYTHEFVAWTPAVPIDATVTEDMTFTAGFSDILRSYTVTWTGDGGTELKSDADVLYGTVPEYSGPVPVKTGEGVEYRFTGWSPELTPVTGDVAYTAVFSVVHSVTVCDDASSYVTVTPAKGIEGESITVAIVGTPTGKTLDHVYFYNGMIDVKVENNVFQMPDCDVTVGAVYNFVDYKISIDAGMTGGTVTSPVATAHYGDLITLSIVPDEGMKLIRLYQRTANTMSELSLETLELDMPAADVTVYAEFEKIDYAVNIQAGIQGGSVKALPSPANIGDEIVITVTPEPGWKMKSLTYSYGDVKDVSIADCRFIMPASDVTVNAEFVKIDYAVNIQAGIQGGSVKVLPSSANIGDEVVVTVTAEAGWKMKSLTYSYGDVRDVSIADCRFIMPASDVTVNAEFEKIDYAVNIQAGIQGGSVKALPSPANVGDEIVITVTPEPGWKMKSLTYSHGDVKDVPIEGCRFIMPASDVTVNAEFVKVLYTVTVDEGVSQYVTASTAQATVGDTVTITVETPDGQEFIGASYAIGDGASVSIIDNKFMMPAGNVVITAVFKYTEHAISVDPGITGGRIVVPAKANVNDTVEVTVDPDDHMRLSALYYTAGNERRDIDTEALSFQMPGCDIVVTAVFEDILYGVLIDDSIVGGSVASEPVSAAFGIEVALTAVPQPGMEFVSFTVTDADGNPVPVENGRFVMPGSPVNVKAVFRAVEKVEIDTEDGKITEDAAQDIIDDLDTMKENDPEAVPQVNVESADTDAVELPSSVLAAVQRNDAVITVSTSVGSMKLSSKALSTLDIPEDSQITLTLQRSSASPAHSGFVKENPVYEVFIGVDGSQIPAVFGESVVLSLPFELNDGQKVGDIKVYYLAPNGSTEQLSGISYEDGMVSFETSHFSQYMIKCETSPDAWTFIGVLAAIIIITGAIVYVMKRTGN